MRALVIFPSAFAIITITFLCEAKAFLNELREAGGAAIGMATAPIQAPLNIIQGKDPTGPYREAIQSSGRVIRNGADAVQQANNIVANVPRDAIDRNFGRDWRMAYDTITFNHRIQVEMGTTAGRYLGGCMSGRSCDLASIVAFPVAASLRDAYKMYAAYAVPLDPEVAQAFSAVVPWHVLQEARFVVGRLPELSLPGFLNSGHNAFGRDHAVTIANLVVFSRQLDLQDNGDIIWLLHELRHIEQYMQYSSNINICSIALTYLSLLTASRSTT